METLEKFTKLGFTFQEPSATDKTYFFTKHTDTDSEQIWVQLKKTPEVEYKLNYVTATIPEKYENLVTEMLYELSFDDYKLLGTE